MSEKNTEIEPRSGREVSDLSALLARIWCYFAGHEITAINNPCARCRHILTYHEIVTPGLLQRIRNWWHYKTAPCKDCGKRFGDHKDCIPF